MFVEPFVITDGVLPGALLTEVTGLFAGNREFHRLSGEFPDPDDIRAEQVARTLAGECAFPGTEVLLARSSGTLVGIAVTMAHHPDPADPDPWITLLMIDSRVHRSGHGRELAGLIEARLRLTGRTAVRLAVLENNPAALRFWTALGYLVIGHREDRALQRPCAVLRKPL